MRLSNDLSKSFTAASKDNKITAAEAQGLLKASLDEIKGSKEPAAKLDAVQERVRKTLGQDHFIQNSIEEKFDEFAKARTVKQAETILDELSAIKSNRKKKSSSGKTGSAYGGKSSGSTTRPSSGYGGKSSGSTPRPSPTRTHGRSTT